MKAKDYFSGLALGAIIGVGVGYWIATDPRRRRKIGRFITNVEDKVNDVKDSIVEKYYDVKDTIADACGCGLSEDEIDELDAILAAEVIADAEAEMEADIQAMQAEVEAEKEAEANNNKKNKKS